MDFDLKSTDQLADIKRMLHEALRELDFLGKDVAGSEFRVTYYQDKIEAAQIREWVNSVSAINRIIEEAMGVANEQREGRSEEGMG